MRSTKTDYAMPDVTMWPKIFQDPSLIPTLSPDHLLADQLVAWGNVLLFGAETCPETFYEVMDACSHVTGAFTMTECKERSIFVMDRLARERKR